MDIILFLTTFIFIIFLFFSYYLGVIRLSVPLVIIYFIFCFKYLINNGHNQDKDFVDLTDSEDITNRVKVEYGSEKNKNNKKDIVDETINNSIPKPIVSFTPKPIVIDSNIIINKDINKKREKIKKANNDTLNELIVANNKDDNQINTLQLNEIMICRGIYKRNPIKPGYNFFNNVDSLFCYTKISNSGPKQEIRHVWSYNNKEISSVVYNIKTSYNYRSWSKKTIYAKQIGDWRVDIVDQNGNVLGSRDFNVKSINNVY